MITIGIIVVTSIISLMALNNHQLYGKLLFSPYVIQRDPKQAYRFISDGFVHGSIGHLFFNMLTLYFFGSVLEASVFTPVEFIVLYLSALVFSSAPVYSKYKDNPGYSAVGASGAVSAIIFSMVLFAPWQVIYIQFFIPLYFILFAVGYLAYSYYMSKRGNDNIGHDAHFYGAIYGVIFTLVIHHEALKIFLMQITRPPFL